MEVKNKALVTGGSRGIGKGICLMLARNGYDVVLNYRSNDEAAMATKKEVEQFGVDCKLLKLDISDYDLCKKTLENEIEKNGSFQVLVHNAAVRKDVLFPVMKKEDWDNVIDVNFKSFYYVVNPVLSGMFRDSFGRIIVMSSTGGLTGMPGQSNYCASKFGIIGAAKSLAIEVARRNINVNIIAPGFIETEMTEQDLGDKEKRKRIVKSIPKRRIGTPEDIANVVEFLISDKAEYIIGQVIPVNGGVFT